MVRAKIKNKILIKLITIVFVWHNEIIEETKFF